MQCMQVYVVLPIIVNQGYLLPGTCIFPQKNSCSSSTSLFLHLNFWARENINVWSNVYRLAPEACTRAADSLRKKNLIIFHNSRKPYLYGLTRALNLLWA